MLSEILAIVNLIFPPEHPRFTPARYLEMSTPVFTASFWYRAAWVVLEAMIRMT